MKKLSNNELQEISGGWFWAFLGGSIMGGITTYLWNKIK
jgi:bacteriocin-like protein